MAWYRSRGVSNPLTALTLPFKWTPDMLKAEIHFPTVNLFREFMGSKSDTIAIVFANEGEFTQSNNQEFTFKYEFSDKTPIQITKFIAARLNLWFARNEVYGVREQSVNSEFSGVRGREIFLHLVKTAIGDDDGGHKVMSKGNPPDRGPGDKLVPVYDEQNGQMEA